MIHVHESFLELSASRHHQHCWCGLQARYTLELLNARLGTGRFARCSQHALRDLQTGDFKLVTVWN